ncbi:MAG: alpha/beta hydrolase [Acidobacteriota bacterium]
MTLQRSSDSVRRIVARIPVVVVVFGVSTLLAGSGTASGQAAGDQGGSIDALVSKFVDVGGVQTRYYDYGAGEPIVLVHGGSMGGASTANNFSRNIPGLAKRFRVIALDRITQGMTGNPKADEDYTNRGVVKHLHQFILTMKLGQIHLVGHSSGGSIVTNLAAEHPEIIRTLTVVTRGAPNEDGPRKFAAILAKCPPDTASYEHRKCRLLALGHTPETFSGNYADIDEYMGNLPKSVEGRRRMAAINARRPGWLAELNSAYRDEIEEKLRAGILQMPILIYGAKQDTLAWSEQHPHAMMKGELSFFDLVGAKNQKVELVIINEAGHFPYREHPAQFNADLMQFIDFWTGRK